jgi:hypothetical protein
VYWLAPPPSAPAADEIIGELTPAIRANIALDVLAEVVHPSLPTPKRGAHPCADLQPVGACSGSLGRPLIGRFGAQGCGIAVTARLTVPLPRIDYYDFPAQLSHLTTKVLQLRGNIRAHPQTPAGVDLLTLDPAPHSGR